MPELFLRGLADQQALSPHPQGIFTRILGLDAQALQWRETLNMLPQITLPDLLLELDNWTGFLRPLTHLTSGDAPVGDEKLVLGLCCKNEGVMINSSLFGA